MNGPKGAERRRDARQVGAALDWVRDLRLRPGLPASLVNLSAGGALIETSTRLRPGGRVSIRVTGAGGRWSVSGRIVRAWVAAIDLDAVRYRGALVFDERVDMAMWRDSGR